MKLYSEQLMRQLEEVGYSVTHDTENPQGEIAVINTCGFIGDAKEESINMILESRTDSGIQIHHLRSESTD